MASPHPDWLSTPSLIVRFADGVQMHAENAFAMEILSLIVMLLALPDNSTIHSDCMSAIQTAWQVLWKIPGRIKK
jgi:hypothetical protein